MQQDKSQESMNHVRQKSINFEHCRMRATEVYDQNRHPLEETQLSLNLNLYQQTLGQGLLPKPFVLTNTKGTTLLEALQLNLQLLVLSINLILSTLSNFSVLHTQRQSSLTPYTLLICESLYSDELSSSLSLSSYIVLVGTNKFLTCLVHRKQSKTFPEHIIGLTKPI